jgi:hypothetical protein
MNFRVLPDHLHDLARAASKYFVKNYGVTGVKVEEEIDPLVDFRPTIHGILADKSIVCIEVAEVASSAELREFVLECRNYVVPAKIWVAIPHGVDVLSTKEISFAKTNGVGIISIDEAGNGRVLVGPPLSQSLTGIRAIEYARFSSRYRGSLQDAMDAFRNGNPSKGCLLVYEEIEALTRRVLKKCAARGCLKKLPSFNVDKESWANVIDFLKVNIDPTKSGCPALKAPIFNRLLGLTEFRNETGHKPSSTKKLVERDRTLRTRFEAAVDELEALVNASKPLKP